MTSTTAVPKGKRPEDERLGVGANLAYGLQHVLTMYGGIIAVPLIVGNAAGLDSTGISLLIASCLFMGGLATILQTVGLPFFGSQLPLVQGVSFANVATILAILSGGGDITTIFGSVIVAAVIGVLIAPFFAKIIRFFPPVVTGTVIATIGLSLLPVAGGWAMGGEGSDSWGDPKNLAVAGGTLVVVLLLSKVGIATVSRLSILIAIVIGTVVASLMGMTDFSDVGQSGAVAVPEPFAFGAPSFELAGIISMLIVVIVTFTESTADMIALGEIVDTKVDSKRIAAGLRADMAASAVSPIFNSFTQSAFAQNVGLVAITGIKSRFVVATGGLILLVMGFLPVVGDVVAAVPLPVLGGAGIVLFGSVAASGIRTLSSVKYEGNMNLIIVAVAISFGMLPEVVPDVYDQFPSWVQVILGSGISAATIMAVGMNLLFNHLRRGTPDEPSVFAAGTGRVITQKQFIRLKEGDYVRNGVLHDASGEEVPVVTKQQAIAVNEALDEGKITCKEDVEQVLEEVKEDEAPLPEGEGPPVRGSEGPPVREGEGPPLRR